MRSALFSLVLCVSAMVCAASPAWAQDGEEPARPGDALALETCLNDAREPSTEHGRTCVGRVSQPCMAAGSYSTMEMVRCLQRERHAWLEIWQQAADTLRLREQPEQRALLNAYLAESENWLEADCAYQASRYMGGSLAGLIGESCRTDHHAELAIHLHGRVWDYDHR